MVSKIESKHRTFWPKSYTDVTEAKELDLCSFMKTLQRVNVVSVALQALLMTVSFKQRGRHNRKYIPRRFAGGFKQRLAGHSLVVTVTGVISNTWSRCAPYYTVSLKIVLLCFYSASALFAMQSAVLARGILAVRPSFRHIPVFRPDKWRYNREVFSIW